MRRKRRVTFALWLAAMLAPSVALADGIHGWVADRLAEEILAGVPVGAADAEPRIAVQSFAAEKTPISLTAANALNASLLSALIAKSGGRHTFVARGALPALVRDVSERARPGPDDPVETLLENARADILVIGTLRRERQQLVLSYKAVATGDGAVLASTKSYRLRLRDQDQATLGLDQAVPVAARYLLQRIDGLKTIQIGDIRYRSEAVDTSFAAYLRDRVVGDSVEPLADKVWRLGADEATTFATSGDLMVGSVHVPAGEYTLFTLTSGDTTELIVSSETGQWGTAYNEDNDLGRTEMTVSTLDAPADQLTIFIENSELRFEWGTMVASVPIVVH